MSKTQIQVKSPAFPHLQFIIHATEEVFSKYKSEHNICHLKNLNSFTLLLNLITMKMSSDGLVGLLWSSYLIPLTAFYSLTPLTN